MNILYDTTDMGLAVALLCYGNVLAELERPLYGAGSRVTFRFKANEDVHQAAQDYWSGNLLVDAKLYWSETKNLKTRLYS